MSIPQFIENFLQALVSYTINGYFDITDPAQQKPHGSLHDQMQARERAHNAPPDRAGVFTISPAAQADQANNKSKKRTAGARAYQNPADYRHSRH